MAQKKKLQVFVSSTYVDLQEERQAAVEAILTAGHIPAGMELFAAGDQSQMNVIRRWIDESDVFLLILGGRYGSVDPATGKSYIHLEYEYALEKGKPLFAVVMKEEYLEEKAKIQGLTVIEREHTQKLRAFRDLVLTKVIKFWKDPRDIKLAIHETMSEYSLREDLTGWIPGDQAVNAGPLAEEIARLVKENASLKEQLAQAPETPRIEPLKEQLFESGNATNRISAAIALGYATSVDVVPLLIKALGDPSGRVCDAAVESLSMIGKKCVPLLLDVLKKNDIERVRYYITKALVEIEGTDTVIELLSKSLKEGDVAVRKRLISALGYTGDARAVPVLVEVLHDEDSYVREAVVNALGEIGDSQAVSVLVEVMNDENSDVRAAVVTAFSEIGGAQAVSILTGALRNDEDSGVREAVVIALEKIGDSQAVPDLIKALKDESDEVRWKVVKTLGELGAAQAVPALAEVLRNDKASRVREAVANALRRTGSTQSVSLLAEALEDEKFAVRRAVVKTLEEIGDSQAVSVLIEALNDGNRDVRAAVVNALGEIGDSQAVSVLVKALNHEEGALRENVVKALGEIGDAHAVPALAKFLKADKSSPIVNELVIKALAKIGDSQAVLVLIEALEDNKNVDWFTLTGALRRIGTPEAIEAIRKSVRERRRS